MARFQTGSYHAFNSYQIVRAHYDDITPYKAGTKLGIMTSGLSPREIDSIKPASSTQRRRKHQIMYLRESDSAVVFKMYRTNVLAFTPDNIAEVTVHPSTTTTSYLNEILPHTVSVHCTSVPPVYQIQDKIYQTPRGTYSFKLKRQADESWAPLDDKQYRPIRDIRLNLSQYYAALKKYKYDEFTDWYKARTSLTPFTEKNYGVTEERQAQFLQGHAGWEAFAAHFGLNALEAAKECILRLAQCFDVREVPYVTAGAYSSVCRRYDQYEKLLNKTSS